MGVVVLWVERGGVVWERGRGLAQLSPGNEGAKSRPCPEQAVTLPALVV